MTYSSVTSSLSRKTVEIVTPWAMKSMIDKNGILSLMQEAAECGVKIDGFPSQSEVVVAGDVAGGGTNPGFTCERCETRH